MDNHGKQELLRHVIENAVHFQRQRRRRRMSSQDIHDAIHALGLRPLLSSLGSSGSETVNTTDVISDPIVGENHIQVNVSVFVPFEAEWTTSSVNFRKRKISVSEEKGLGIGLSERTKFVVDTVVNSCHSGEAIPTGITTKETLITAWMLGLHFSNMVSTSTVLAPIDCNFVRNAVWFLQRALALTSSREISGEIQTTWISGFQVLAEGRTEILCDSPQQRLHIQKVCRKLLDNLSS
jgi:hypothetical protein